MFTSFSPCWIYSIQKTYWTYFSPSWGSRKVQSGWQEASGTLVDLVLRQVMKHQEPQRTGQALDCNVHLK